MKEKIYFTLKLIFFARATEQRGKSFRKDQEQDASLPKDRYHRLLSFLAKKLAPLLNNKYV